MQLIESVAIGGAAVRFGIPSDAILLPCSSSGERARAREVLSAARLGEEDIPNFIEWICSIGERRDQVLGLMRVLPVPEGILLVLHRVASGANGQPDSSDVETIVDCVEVQGVQIPVAAMTEVGSEGAFNDVRISRVSLGGFALTCRSECRTPMPSNQLTAMHQSWVRSMELRVDA